MIVVRVYFFGGQQFFTPHLRPDVACDLPKVTLPAGATVNDLLERLAVPTGAGRPFITVNGFYRRDDVPLRDGDQVELVPPVAGG